jgi:hypothetical protein
MELRLDEDVIGTSNSFCAGCRWLQLQVKLLVAWEEDPSPVCAKI